MPILTQFLSHRWKITLSREVSDTETTPIPASDITVTTNRLRNAVTRISGTGKDRIITLTTAVETLMLDNLPTSAITINQINYPRMTVTAVENADLLDALQQIRNLLRIGLTSTDLPDSTIREQVFLRAAENEVYDATNLNDASYDTRAANDPAFKERTQTAVMYRAAALLLYSLPEIVSEAVLQQSVRYREIDIDMKINFWLKSADQAIEPDIVDPQYRQGAAIGSSWTRTTYF